MSDDKNVRFSVRVWACLLSAGSIVLVLASIQMCRNHSSSPTLTYEDVDSAYCDLIDIRGRAQMELRANSSVSYLSQHSFTNTYPDKFLGSVMDNNYMILADFSGEYVDGHPLPPLMSVPFEIMEECPGREFPVLLMIPDDNDFEHVMTLVRVALLKKKDVDAIVSDSEFSVEALSRLYPLQPRVDHQVWKLFSQDLLFQYFQIDESY